MIADQGHSQRWKLQYSIVEIRYERPFPGTLPTPPNDSPLHHHLFRPNRSRKIILSHQHVTLLGDPWWITKPRTNHMQRELALQFRLPDSSPLLKRYRVEQSWPTRDAGAAKQARHLAA